MNPYAIGDELVDEYSRAYSAMWDASTPITQGEATAVERNAIRAGLGAALALLPKLLADPPPASLAAGPVHGSAHTPAADLADHLHQEAR